MTEAERALLIAIAKDVRDSRCADPAHIQRLIIAAQAPANAVPPNAVKIPESEEEAALMGLLGTNWLEQHAPHRLKPDRPKIVATEPSINIDSELNRKWTFSPNSMPDTHHFGPKSAEPKPSAYGHQEHCNYPGSPCACKEPKPPSPSPPYKMAIEIFREHWHQNHSLETAFEAAAPYICKGKDRDTATVIADNDAKIEELERLKCSLELYRADIGVLQERGQKMREELSLLREENTKLARAAIAPEPDIEAAAERARVEHTRQFYQAGRMNWKAVARAVYGLPNENA